MNFYRWMIKKHINDHAPVGDLARDMKGDKQFPHDGDKAKIQESGICRSWFEFAIWRKHPCMVWYHMEP